MKVTIMSNKPVENVPVVVNNTPEIDAPKKSNVFVALSVEPDEDEFKVTSMSIAFLDDPLDMRLVGASVSKLQEKFGISKDAIRLCSVSNNRINF